MNEQQTLPTGKDPTIEVIETYIDLKKALTELRLHERVIWNENDLEEKTLLDLVYVHLRDCHDVGLSWDRRRVQDLSFDNIKTEIIPCDESLDPFITDSLWQTKKDGVITAAREHETAVGRLEETQDGVAKDMMMGIISHIEEDSRSLEERYLSTVDWSLGPPDYENPLNTQESTPGRHPFGIEQPIALAEMVRCTKRYAKDVFRGRHELTEEVKSEVDNRDNECCVHCSSTEDLVYHHIIPASRGGKSVRENVARLCHTCHCDVHLGGGDWATTVYDTIDEFWEWVNDDDKTLSYYHEHPPSLLERQIPIEHSTIYQLNREAVRELQQEGIETIGDFVTTPIEKIKRSARSTRQLGCWKHNTAGLEVCSIWGIDEEIRRELRREFGYNKSGNISIKALKEATREELMNIEGMSTRRVNELQKIIKSDSDHA